MARMKMKLVSVKPTPSKSKKKLIAVFDDGMTIQFGSKGSKTYSDGNVDEKIKNAYLARHSKDNENWNTHSAGALSRWVLWSAKTVSQGIKNYNKNVNGL
jgi:hypothetical protein